MRHFLKLDGLTEGLRCSDVFDDAISARRAAISALRHMMARPLLDGRPIPSDWAVHIVDGGDQVVEVLTAESVALEKQPRAHHARLYTATLHPYLMMNPELAILEANPAYLTVTMTSPEVIRHRPMFEVFPDNPDDPTARATSNLGYSLRRVLAEKQMHVMATQKYDIRRPDGSWEERYWNPVNFPLLDENGEVELVVHHVEDVTARAKLHRGLRDESKVAGYYRRARECDNLARRSVDRDYQHTMFDLAAQWRKLAETELNIYVPFSDS